MKNLPLEIGEVVGKRSVRDRFVIDLWLQCFTYEEISEQLKEQMPDEPRAIPTIHRIIERFRDEMRERLADR